MQDTLLTYIPCFTEGPKATTTPVLSLHPHSPLMQFAVRTWAAGNSPGNYLLWVDNVQPPPPAQGWASKDQLGLLKIAGGSKLGDWIRQGVWIWGKPLS